MPVIRTQRLLLRPVAEEDAEALTEACSDPAIPRYMPVIPSPYRRADADDFVRESATWWRDGTEATFAIVDAGSQELLGVIGVGLGDGESIGYWVASGARGRGVATEAFCAVVDWVRTAHGVRRVCLMTHPANAASQRVAEKAGFRRQPGTVEHMPFRDGERRAIRFDRVTDEISGSPAEHGDGVYK
jgi:RimJ/RimL family protein N-acetyltransferase